MGIKNIKGSGREFEKPLTMESMEVYRVPQITWLRAKGGEP